MLSLLLAPIAFANTPAEPLPSAVAPAVRLSDAATDDADAAAPSGKKRDYLMEVGFRGRYLTVPREILNGGVEAHDNDEYPRRPELNAYSLGLEFVVKNKSANGIFYVEYLNSLMEPGYWDDRDRDAGENGDGSWIEPVNFGLVTIGADYAYEIHATNWFSVLFGAGLGAGIVLGDIKERQAGEDPSDPEGNNNNADPSCGPMPMAAYERHDLGCKADSNLVADGTVPPVVPMVDINIGVRFNISDRASIRLEGGLHDLFYGGGAVSVVF